MKRHFNLIYLIFFSFFVNSIYAQQPCEGLTVSVNGAFNFCSFPQTGQFTANTAYEGVQPPNSPVYTYSWNFQGEIKSGQSVSHEYTAPGVYPFTLTVTDNANGCQSVFTQNVRVATVPSFNGTRASADTVCAREVFSLQGNVNPVTWTGFPTSVETIARVAPGQDFVSSLSFNVFGAQQITSVDDFDRVCISIEHINFGDVEFELICPNGSSVMLKHAVAGGANLGEPVVFDDNIPGVGYQYCFSHTSALGLMMEAPFQEGSYMDQGNTYVPNREYLPSGRYTIEGSLADLIGCPLNGTWTISVADNTPGSAGHVFGWSLFFDEELYPETLIMTPQIVDDQWFDRGNSVADPARVNLSERGEYAFLYRATDELGCAWDTTIVITVLPLPRAEITSELEIPVCEGDSTIFSVVPINGDNNFNWIYEWMMEGAELAGRYSDTLMAKQPATYSVIVADTLTGCFISLEETLFTKNCDLEIPNVFTPNGDGINDYFEITNLDNYPFSQMVIFNRNGKKIFEHSDYDGNWWDGGNHPNGTYFYILTYVRLGTRRQIQGIVTLLR
jgi:gliding motility-associated-like protein